MTEIEHWNCSFEHLAGTEEETFLFEELRDNRYEPLQEWSIWLDAVPPERVPGLYKLENRCACDNFAKAEYKYLFICFANLSRYTYEEGETELALAFFDVEMYLFDDIDDE